MVQLVIPAPWCRIPHLLRQIGLPKVPCWGAAVTQIFRLRSAELRNIRVRFALGASGDVHATLVALLLTDTSFCQVYGIHLTHMRKSCVMSKLAAVSGDFFSCRERCRLQLQFLSLARPAPAAICSSNRFELHASSIAKLIPATAIHLMFCISCIQLSCLVMGHLHPGRGSQKARVPFIGPAAGVMQASTAQEQTLQVHWATSLRMMHGILRGCSRAWHTAWHTMQNDRQGLLRFGMMCRCCGFRRSSK